MRYSEGSIGRIFVLSLDNGDKLPACLENFAAEKKISRGMCVIVGGIDDGGNIVVGPKDGKTMPPDPILHRLTGVHEICAVGTLFPDTEGRPRLHMHAAFGREGETRTGCIRPGVEVWRLGEVIILEITNNSAVRKKDAQTGFDMLDAGDAAL